MSTNAQADNELPTDTTLTEPKTLQEEVEADAEAAETREDRISLFVDYVQLRGVTTELDGDEVYAPVRLFAEAMLDCRITYTQSTKTVKVTADGFTLEAKAGDYYAVSNGRYLYIENGVDLREDGQIWLPVSVLAKVFGCEYKLDLESKAVHLTTTGVYLEQGDKYYNKKDLYWLSRIINAEARGESIRGQVAVGTVVMNRVAHPKFPNTVYGVIFHGNHFSPAVSGTIYKAPLEKCVIAAKIVLEGYRVSDSIIYFHSIRSNAYDGFVNTETEMVIDHQFFYTTFKRK